MPLTGRGSAPGAGTDRPVRRWHADRAWLPGRGVHAGVLIEAAGRHFTAVTPGVAPADCPPGTARLAGFTMPGLANAHSHAFHRALRGVVQAGQGTFWTWRGPGPSTPRWRWPGSPAWGSSTTCTTTRAVPVTPTPTRWAGC